MHFQINFPIDFSGAVQVRFRCGSGSICQMKTFRSEQLFEVSIHRVVSTQCNSSAIPVQFQCNSSALSPSQNKRRTQRNQKKKKKETNEGSTAHLVIFFGRNSSASPAADDAIQRHDRYVIHRSDGGGGGSGDGETRPFGWRVPRQLPTAQRRCRHHHRRRRRRRRRRRNLRPCVTVFFSSLSEHFQSDFRAVPVVISVQLRSDFRAV